MLMVILVNIREDDLSILPSSQTWDIYVIPYSTMHTQFYYFLASHYLNLLHRGGKLYHYLL